MYALPMGICPKCHGNKIGCNNCGGQYMYSNPKGEVPLRPDGTPCLHDYVHSLLNRPTLHRYTCRHCHDSFTIDSGD
jgi:hypothetical protein